MNPDSAIWNREDRDLLVELRTTLAAVQRDIKEIKDGTSQKLAFLETDKLSRAEAVRLSTENFSKHGEFDERIGELETRTTALEDGKIEWRASVKTWGIVGAVALFVFQFLTTVYFHYH
jgi:hypothetical protein